MAVGAGRKRSREDLDEPRPGGEDDGWESWGGEMIMAMGHTEGGAPYGVTADEFRRANEECEPRAGWARAKEVLRRALGGRGARDADDAIGWVRFVAEGLTYVAYAADCLLDEPREATLVVRLPRDGVGPDQADAALRESRLLDRLATLDLPFRVPRMVAAEPVRGGVALVQEMLHGIPLDPRAGRQPGVRPFEVVAEVAAACHSLPAERLRDVLPGFETRREHALAELAVLDRLDLPEAGDARAFAERHLPSGPARALHGDLLGQNILLSLDGERCGVVDWSGARIGDAAYDLAVVTRGVRQPFQLAGGLRKLVAAYGARAPAPVSVEEVRVYEICIAAWRCCDARQDPRGGAAADEAERNFASLVRRTLAGAL